MNEHKGERQCCVRRLYSASHNFLSCLYLEAHLVGSVLVSSNAWSCLKEPVLSISRARFRVCLVDS